MIEANSILEKLVANISDAGNVDGPDWSDCFQSWRYYVPDEIRHVWQELPREARLMAVILGNELSEKQNWE